MKILSIMGSPKGKGNTYRTVQRFEEELHGVVEFDIEYFFLKDANIQTCRGCFVCIEKGEKKCPLKDDLPSLIEKITNSDAIIVSTPAYAMNVSGLLKNLIDRTAYILHRPRFFQIPIVFVATTGGVGLKQVFKSLDVITGMGFEFAGNIGAIFSPFPLPKFMDQTDRQIRQTVKRLVKILNRKRLGRATFSGLLHYHSMGAVMEMGQEFAPVDYDYWKEKGWFDRKTKFFYPARIGLLNRVFYGLYRPFMNWGMKKMMKSKRGYKAE